MFAGGRKPYLKISFLWDVELEKQITSIFLDISEDEPTYTMDQTYDDFGEKDIFATFEEAKAECIKRNEELKAFRFQY